MKKLTTLLFFFLQSTCLFAQERLTNQEVVSLVQAKVSKSLILDKIKASICQFDMSTAGLIDLRVAKVPDPIVDAMMLAS